jgi:hypothetical protein
MLGGIGGMTDWEHLGRQGAHRKLIRAAVLDNRKAGPQLRNPKGVARQQQRDSPDRRAIGAYFPVSLLSHLVPPLRWNDGVVTSVSASLRNPITQIGGSSIRQTSNSRNPHPGILAGGRAGLLIFDFNAQRAPVRPLATLFQLAIAQAAARVQEARRAAQRAADRIGRQGNPQ